MALDISHLSPEKRAFLKAYPGFIENLEEAIPQQLGKIQDRKDRLKKTKSYSQREIDGLFEKLAKERGLILDPRLKQPRVKNVKYSVKDEFKRRGLDF